MAEYDAATAMEVRASRGIAILLFVFCLGNVLTHLPGALHGEAAPVRPRTLEFGGGPAPSIPAWTGQGQAVFLLVVYALLALACLYVAARPIGKRPTGRHTL